MLNYRGSNIRVSIMRTRHVAWRGMQHAGVQTYLQNSGQKIRKEGKGWDGTDLTQIVGYC